LFAINVHAADPISSLDIEDGDSLLRRLVSKQVATAAEDEVC
jgi:hypothetical protein